MARKHKVRLVNGSICIEPGLYELFADINVPRTNFKTIEDGDFWFAGERFLVQQLSTRIGDQPNYTYYTLQKIGSIRGHHRVKSYETERWNTVVSSLVRIDD